MSRRFEVTLHGTGFSVPVEGEKPIRGFYTIRRVVAESLEDAERSVMAALQQEAKYQWLMETTERELGSRAGCSVTTESIGLLSWWRWHFSKPSTSFIFYSEDANDA